MPARMPDSGEYHARKANWPGLRIDAVVFDMDGVIIDSRRVIEDAWRTVAGRRGKIIQNKDFDRHVHGRVGAETVRILFPDAAQEEQRRIWAEVDRVEESARYAEIPGATGFISMLGANHVLLGLATSSWPRKVGHVLRMLGMADTFAAVVTRDDIAESKPHPEIYLKISDLLGVSVGKMLVFEDSSNGVKSAAAARAVCIGIGGEDLEAAGAIATVPNFRCLSLDRQSPESCDLAGPGLSLHISVAGPEQQRRVASE